MNNDIKEILDKLQKVANRETASRNALMEMKDKDYQLLLDYIINLQEEIQKKEAMYDSLAVDYRLAQEENERLNNITNNALEKILSLKIKLYSEPPLWLNELQDILEGK